MADKKRARIFTDKGVHDLTVGRDALKTLSSNKGKSAVTGKKATNKRVLAETREATKMMINGARRVNKTSAAKRRRM